MKTFKEINEQIKEKAAAIQAKMKTKKFLGVESGYWAAVQNAGRALKYAANALKADKEVVLAALQNSC